MPSNSIQIRLCVSFIRQYGKEVKAVLAAIHKFVAQHDDELFVRHIRLIETIPGADFLSAVTVLCEIGDFSVFKS